MFKGLLIAAAGSMVALSAFAFEMSDIQKSVQLKNETTVHIFKDGKMGMEDRFGRAVGMPEGRVMETRGGQPIIMVGNETARLDNALRAQWRN